jgi:hypothetical protein
MSLGREETSRKEGMINLSVVGRGDSKTITEEGMFFFCKGKGFLRGGGFEAENFVRVNSKFLKPLLS